MAAEKVEVKCSRCNHSCYGEVVKSYGRYYHPYCFKCAVVGCNEDLAKVGFFLVDDEIFCRDDYQKSLGMKCAGCLMYMDGDALAVACVSCDKVFPVATEICNDGGDFFCQSCNGSPRDQGTSSVPTLYPRTKANENPLSKIEIRCHNDNIMSTIADIRVTHEGGNSIICAGCTHEIKSGKVVWALEKAWHSSCFKCNACGVTLTKQHMEKDGLPYCKKDYNAQFGVCCAACGGYMTGQVMEAADKYYHPRCCRCVKCGERSEEGEDMYLQGNGMWHPACSKKTKTLKVPGRDSSKERLKHDKERTPLQEEAVWIPLGVSRPHVWKPENSSISIPSRRWSQKRLSLPTFTIHKWSAERRRANTDDENGLSIESGKMIGSNDEDVLDSNSLPSLFQEDCDGF